MELILLPSIILALVIVGFAYVIHRARAGAASPDPSGGDTGEPQFFRRYKPPPT